MVNSGRERERMREETSPSCLCPSIPGAMEADFLSRRRRESKAERSKPQLEYSSAAVHPSIRPSVIPSSRASDAPNCHFGRCAVYFSPSFPRPTVSRGRDFCRYRAFIGDVHYARGSRGHYDHAFSALRGWQLLQIPKICGHYMCTFPDVKTSLFLPRPSSPPSCSPRATAKSSDITRMFQRLEGEREGGREGGRGGHRRSHAHMHKSAGRSVCVVSRPHVVKRSRFLCLFLHKRRRRRQRPKQAAERGQAHTAARLLLFLPM